jgi:hypothetical protein
MHHLPLLLPVVGMVVEQRLRLLVLLGMALLVVLVVVVRVEAI